MENFYSTTGRDDARRNDTFWIALFIYMYGDVFWTYNIENLTGVSAAPVTFVALPALLYYSVRYGAQALLPPPNIGFAFGLFAAALMYCWLFVQDEAYVVEHWGGPLRNAISLATSAGALVVGYATARQVRDSSRFLFWLSIAAVVYAVVCAIAILQVLPSLFPVDNSTRFWIGGNRFEVRSRIMTDQNFQALYLVPLAPLLMVCRNRILFSATLIGFLAGAFSVVKMQSRSGFLVFGACTAAALMLPVAKWAGTRMNKVVVVALLIGLATLSGDVLFRTAAGLIARFTSGDMGAATSAEFRVVSNMYVVEHVLDPEYWLPVGMGQFMARHGSYPHSNLATCFMQAGLFGLVFWFVAFCIPPLQCVLHVTKGRREPMLFVIAVVGVGVMALQLSLQTLLTKQVWLWAGACLGASLQANRDRPVLAPTSLARIMSRH